MQDWKNSHHKLYIRFKHFTFYCLKTFRVENTCFTRKVIAHSIIGPNQSVFDTNEFKVIGMGFDDQGFFCPIIWHASAGWSAALQKIMGKNLSFSPKLAFFLLKSANYSHYYLRFFSKCSHYFFHCGFTGRKIYIGACSYMYTYTEVN